MILHLFAAIDNWLFLILIGVAALFRLLAKAASSTKTSEPPEQSSSPPANQIEQPRESPASDEEQIRKFLEALGQPRSANVPRPVRPRTDVPPRPVAPVRPPTTMAPVSDLRKLMPASGKEVEAGAATPDTPSIQRGFQPKPAVAIQPRDVPVYEIDTPSQTLERVGNTKATQQLAAERQTATDSAGSDVIQLLRSPRSLRQAIILREIFGAPRGLQPMEDLPGTA
ncbi:MAG: hypothetical protein ACJ8M1_02325 [Chthoniobacterales bacterium]